MSKLDDIKKINNCQRSKPKRKTFLGIFVLVFLLSLLIINWSEVSWIFNHRVFADFLSEKFLSSETIEAPEISKIIYVEREDSVVIPKIEVAAPLVLAASDELSEIDKALDMGVTHYASSALPGEKGEVMILGHSAPVGWPKIKYHHVFNRLEELENGDEIFIYFQNREYQYKVINKMFVEPGTELQSSSLTNQDSVLFLLSCWPPGKLYKRIVIEAEQIS